MYGLVGEEEANQTAITIGSVAALQLRDKDAQVLTSVLPNRECVGSRQVGARSYSQCYSSKHILSPSPFISRSGNVSVERARFSNDSEYRIEGVIHGIFYFNYH